MFSGPRFIALFVIFGVWAGCKSPPNQDIVRVAAAANLRDAFEELSPLFEAKHGTQVVFTFGSSGILARQIQQGAPFDVFAAANREFVDDVAESKTCDATTITHYGRGRLVLWSPAGITDLNDPRIQRLAIANPEHAPYGKAAKEALIAMGMWEHMQTKLVYGENIRQTLQFAETGNVDAALVALSLVIHDTKHPWMLIDEDSHTPLEQAIIVCNGGTNRTAGKDFTSFVNGPQGREVMRHYGFLLPNEQTIQSP